MSKTSHYTEFNNIFHFPLKPILQRINRRLGNLVPKRELYYVHSTKDYFVRVVERGHPDHLQSKGPYYFCHMIALADFLEIWQPSERHLVPKTLVDREGKVYTQEHLPQNLTFKVVSNIEADAVAQLRAQGWTLIPPTPVPIVLPANPGEPTREITQQELAAVQPSRALQITNWKPDDAVPDVMSGLTEEERDAYESSTDEP